MIRDKCNKMAAFYDSMSALMLPPVSLVWYYRVSGEARTPMDPRGVGQTRHSA